MPTALSSTVRRAQHLALDLDRDRLPVIEAAREADAEGRAMGALKIRERVRRQWSPKPGHRQVWTEFQVIDGRKIVGRHDFHHQAQRQLDKLKAERKAAGIKEG